MRSKNGLNLDKVSDRPEAQLRARGLRVTSQRLSVLRAIERRPHCTAEDVVAEVRADIGAVSRQAIYHVRYDPRLDPHHHLICRGCGAAIDVDCSVDPAPLARAAELGFRVDLTEVTFWGRCPRCQKQSLKPNKPNKPNKHTPPSNRSKVLPPEAQVAPARGRRRL
jgi:Fur family transcriptional regulator, stress-responsive regulator